MSSRNATRPRGFDPLSSLFDVVDPANADELGIPEETDSAEVGGQVDFTDPLFKSPPDIPAPPAADVPEPRGLHQPPPPVAAPAAEIPDPGGEPEPQRAVAPAPAEPTIDKAAIAKAVAKAAAARAAAQRPAAPPAPVAPPAAPAPVVAPAPTSRAAAPAPAPAPAPAAAGPRSRLAALAASGAGRKLSALEAAKAAAEAEQQAQVEGTARIAAHEAGVQARKAGAMSERVQALIPQWLPSVGELRVANAMIADQREVLKAVWRSHRARFLADGQLERGVGAAAVLHALQHTPQGDLVAAHVVTQASDYLVWLDLSGGSLVAAFADARSYFGGPVGT